MIDISDHKTGTLREVYEKYANAKYVYLNRRYVKSIKLVDKTISKEEFIKRLDEDLKKGEIDKVGYEEAVKAVNDGFFKPISNEKVAMQKGNIEFFTSNIILRELYVLNKSGNLKQATIFKIENGKGTYSSIVKELTKKINKYIKDFTENDTYKLINNHFWTREEKKEDGLVVTKIGGLREKI